MRKARLRRSLSLERPRPPRTPLFPYTTLFRSRLQPVQAVPQALEVVPVVGGELRLPGDRDYLEGLRSEEHTSELQSHSELVCRLLLEKKDTTRSASRSTTSTLPSTR